MSPDTTNPDSKNQTEAFKAQEVELYLLNGLKLIELYQPTKAIQHLMNTNLLSSVGINYNFREVEGFDYTLPNEERIPDYIKKSGFTFAVVNDIPEIKARVLPLVLYPDFDDFNPFVPISEQLDCIALNYALAYLDVVRYFKKSEFLTNIKPNEFPTLSYLEGISSKNLDSLRYFMDHGIQEISDTFIALLRH